MGYDTFYLGWAAEATPGTSTITDASSTAYKVGTVADNCFLPDPTWDLLRVVPDWGERATSELVKTRQRPATETFAFLLHNALPVYWAVGDSATVGTVHTLTAGSQVAGVIPDLPSLTFHAERIDKNSVLTDWQTQYKGMRNVVARFFCGDDDPLLTAVMGFMGMSVADPGFVLTNKPADVTGTHTAPLHYKWAGCTHKYDSNTINGVSYWELAITNGTFPVAPDYGSTSPSAVYAGRHQTIDLTVRYRPDADTLYDDLLTSTVPAKDWEFEFVRDATDDKLKFTCTTAATIAHPLPQPSTADQFEVELTAAVTSLTVTATDQIAAGFYGD